MTWDAAAIGPILVALAGGYGLGSIPFGLLLTRLAGLGDVRAIGSGNIGATNVLRTGRKDIAALTLLLDGGKGTAAAVLGALLLGPELAFPAGFAAVVGHCTCPWLGFKGGKGVATGLGTILGWSAAAGVACCLLWIATALVGKRSSLSGLVSFAAAPVLLYFLAGPPAASWGLLVAVLVVARHRANIRRILDGTEPRIGASKASTPK